MSKREPMTEAEALEAMARERRRRDRKQRRFDLARLDEKTMKVEAR